MKNQWTQNEVDKRWEDNVRKRKQVETVTAGCSLLQWTGEREDICKAVSMVCSVSEIDPEKQRDKTFSAL